MKIIVLTLFPILPEDDGFKRRVLNIYRNFPKGIDIFYVSIFKPSITAQNLYNKTGLKCHSTSFYYHRSLLLKYYLKSLLIKIHPLALTLQNNKLQNELGEIIKNINPDYIISESVWPLFAITKVDEIKYIIDEHNIEYLLIKREAQILPLTKIYLKIIDLNTWEHLRRQELLYIKNSQITFTVSEVDKKILIFEGILNAKLKVIPNGVNASSHNEALHHDEKKFNIAFMGALDYHPNADALKIIYQKIYPLIKQKINNLKFIIIGKNPPRWLTRIAKKNPDFMVTGKVPDPNKFLSMAHVCIAPLRSGSGTRLKILEYMALKKPVISTIVGAEGLKVKHGENILLSDDWNDFSNQIIYLSINQKVALQISKSAQKIAQDIYDWKKISNDVFHCIKNI